jgi:hypothetical protein
MIIDPDTCAPFQNLHILHFNYTMILLLYVKRNIQQKSQNIQPVAVQNDVLIGKDTTV